VRRFISFGAVGALATAVHVAVASGLITAAGWPAGLANGAAFCVATFVSYSLQSRLTFRRAMSRRTLWRFVAVAAAGAGLSMAISGGAERLGLHYLVGIALVVISLPLLTFLAHSRWTYR
jgi:putative flippase GtrA